MSASCITVKLCYFADRQLPALGLCTTDWVEWLAGLMKKLFRFSSNLLKMQR